jgi:hypothetical protein
MHRAAGTAVGLGRALRGLLHILDLVAFKGLTNTGSRTLGAHSRWAKLSAEMVRAMIAGGPIWESQSMLGIVRQPALVQEQ